MPSQAEKRLRIVRWWGIEYNDGDYGKDGAIYHDVVENASGLLFLRFSATWDQYYASIGYDGVETIELSEDETYVVVHEYDKSETRTVKIPKKHMRNAGAKALAGNDSLEAVADYPHMRALLESEKKWQKAKG